MLGTLNAHKAACGILKDSSLETGDLWWKYSDISDILIHSTIYKDAWHKTYKYMMFCFKQIIKKL